jgi:hemerythrin
LSVYWFFSYNKVMAVPWSEKYSVGIAVIDEQHKQFVFIMDKLSKAIEQVKPKEVLSQIFNDLDNYVSFHFGTEEKYFIEFKYAGTAEHVEAHRNFQSRLTEIKEKYGRDELRLSLELIAFLADWLEKHVQDMDRKYIETFHENGVI